MSKKGLFITFEGGEGAGKTTLIDKVHDALSSKGLSLLKTRAPGGTRAGALIREMLLHKTDISLKPRCELFLFLADRAQHVDEVISPAIKSGQIVLCDRFSDSTIAYQGAARGLDTGKVKALCDEASNHLQPDLTIYLDLDPLIGLERVRKDGIAKDRIESEALAFHRALREAFQRIAKDEPKRFRVVDASQSKDQVFKQAMALIDELL